MYTFTEYKTVVSFWGPLNSYVPKNFVFVALQPFLLLTLLFQHYVLLFSAFVRNIYCWEYIYHEVSYPLSPGKPSKPISIY